MKMKLIRLFALTVCVIMVFSSLTCLSAFADDSSSAVTSNEDIWDSLKPAYMATAYSSITARMAGDDVVSPMICYAVIDGYAFYGDALTGEMVFLKLVDASLTKEAIDESGEIPEYTAYYCTNPYNIGSSKALGATESTAASEKEKLYSQLIIKYSENDKDTEMNSFADAAVNNQITVKNIRNGVRVEYTIGREEVNYLVPRLIKAEKLEALRDQIAANSLVSRDPRSFMAFYILKDLSDPNLSEKGKAEMEAQYPITKQFAVYVCEPLISTQELLRLEKLVVQYTDYDYDTLDADHAETDYQASDDVPPLFKLALEYKVDGSEITIRCKSGNIRFDSSVYKLSDVVLLPYGGAGDVNNSGYLFSPDGSGSLLDFSDFGTSMFTNSTSLYGQDYAYHTISGANSEVARLPVFGVYQKVENNSTVIEEKPVYDENGDPTYDDDGNPITEQVEVSVPLEIAYLAVIESGSSLAKVNVNYGGSLHMYASVYTSFNPRPKDSYTLSGGISAGTDAMWTVESKRKYTGDYKIRLFILDGTEDGDTAPGIGDAEKSYSDMAAAYRKYLVSTGVLTEITDTDSNIPLYLETLGAIETTKTVLGVPVTTTIAMTSFDATKEILETLKKAGITNVKVKLSGWYNDGMLPNVPTSITIEKVMGGKDGFNSLLEYANENNITLFPDVELSLAYSDKWFDGFDSSNDLSQTIDERTAIMQEYDPIWQGYIKNGIGIISPSFMKELYAGAYKDYQKLNVGAISVCSLGKYLSSDFNTDNPLTREDSRELITQLLETIASNNEKVLVAGGNEYTIKYATDIIDVPLDDSRYMYSYATIPFMSMVLHGYKQFTGTALNLAGDYNYQILKTIESGASPYYVVAVNDTSELKQYTYSNLSQYYSVRCNIWMSDIITAYNELNEALGDVQNQTMLKHTLLTDDGKVAKVTYANGTAFYINYRITEYTAVEGDTEYVIPAEGYLKVSADGKVIMKGEGDR